MNESEAKLQDTKKLYIQTPSEEIHGTLVSHFGGRAVRKQSFQPNGI